MNYLYDTSENYLTGLGESAVDQVKYLYSIADGTVGKQLTAQRTDIAKQKQTLDAQRVAVKAMEEGANKSKAVQLLTQANQLHLENMQRLNKAIKDHNTIVEKIKEYSFGLVKPPTVTGLAALPLLPVAGIIAAVGLLVLALGVAIPAIANYSTQTKGLIAQVSDLVAAGGGVIQDTGNTLMKTALAVGGVLLAIFLFQEARTWKRTRAPKGSTPASKKDETVSEEALFAS